MLSIKWCKPLDSAVHGSTASFGQCLLQACVKLLAQAFSCGLTAPSHSITRAFCRAPPAGPCKAEPSAHMPHCMETLQAVPVPHSQAHALQQSCSSRLASMSALQVDLPAAPCSMKAPITVHRRHVVRPLSGVPLNSMLAYTRTTALSLLQFKQSHLQACAVLALPLLH